MSSEFHTCWNVDKPVVTFLWVSSGNKQKTKQGKANVCHVNFRRFLSAKTSTNLVQASSLHTAKYEVPFMFVHVSVPTHTLSNIFSEYVFLNFSIASYTIWILHLFQRKLCTCHWNTFIWHPLWLVTILNKCKMYDLPTKTEEDVYVVQIRLTLTSYNMKILLICYVVTCIVIMIQ